MSSTHALTSNITCEICFDSFDLETRLPKLLNCCGKSLCRMCLQKNLQTGKMRCPWSKHNMSSDINSYKTNLQLLNIIEEEIKWERCPDHVDEKLKYFCTEDRSKKCGHCLFTTNCKYHKLIPLLDLKADSDKRLRILQGHLKNVDNQTKKYNKLIIQNKPVLQEMVEKSFEEQIFQLKKARVKTMIELTSAFNKKQNEISNQYGETSSLRAELQAKVYDHMNILKAKDPMGAIQEDLTLLNNRVDSLIGGGQDFLNFEQQLSKVTGLFQQNKVNPGFNELIGHLKAGFGAEMRQEMPVKNANKGEEEIEIKGKKMSLEISGNKQLSIMGNLQDRMIVLEVESIRGAREISIDARSLEFNEINLKAIGSVLEKINLITKVSFTSGCNFEVKLDKISELFSMVFRNPREVTSLSMNLPKNDDILLLFNILLPQLSSLKELIVAFPPNEVCAKICENFAEGLCSIAGSLEHLNLNLSQTSFPVASFKGIFISMPYLTKFSLNVSKISCLNDQILTDTTQNLQSLMPKLSELSFDVSGTSCTVNDLPALRYIPKVSIFSDVPVKIEPPKIAQRSVPAQPLFQENVLSRLFQAPPSFISSESQRNSLPAIPYWDFSDLFRFS